MSRKFIGITLGIVWLALAAACASQPGASQSTRPTLDISAPTPTPETLPPLDSGEVKNPQPTLEVGQPTPTPEARPPSGGQLPDPALVQPLNTTPFSLSLKDADDGDLAAEFYPAPQPGSAALLLVSSATAELPAWKLVAQTAQVKGLAALVLELPESGATSQAINAGLLWLAAPENGAFDKIVTAGSGSGTGAGQALAAFGMGPQVRAAVVFFPQTQDPGLKDGLQAAAGQPLLVIQSRGKVDLGMPSGGNLEVITVPDGQQGVDVVMSQDGLLEQVLDWCLNQVGG